jgi:glycosyltransferase involved in cell wall biosynthesis
MAERSVLFFIFRLHGGGAERVVSNLSMDFAKRFTIKIAVYDRLEEVYPHEGELIRIKAPFSANPDANNWCIRAIRLWVISRQLRKIKKTCGIDTTISFGDQANIINVLSGGRGMTVLSVRTVLSNIIRNTPKMKILRLFIRILYNKGHHIIVPSKVAGQDLVKYFNVSPEKVKVIYNYLDQGKITGFSLEKIDDPFLQELFEQPVLLNVGRINPAKGQWLLLEMMKEVKQRYPGWKLVIIGDAEKGERIKEQLTARAEQLGLRLYDSSAGIKPSLDEDVYLLGFQANPYRYMRRSRVLLFPSAFEGFPNTILEAMQAGLPVISADCHSGPREIMAPDSDLHSQTRTCEYTPYGILCPALPTADIRDSIDPEIIAEWLKALFHVIEDDQLRESLVQNGYKKVKHFDKAAILQQWQDSLTVV